MSTKPVWGARREELERLVEEGKGLREIADYYGVSTAAAGCAMRRMGLKMKPEDVARRQQERIKAIHENPEKRAQWLEAVVKANQDPKRKAEYSAWMRQRWKDPEYRAFISEMSKRAHKDPEYKAKVRVGSLKGGAAYKRKVEYEKWFKSLSPFEQKLELVKAGKARISVNWNRRRV